MRMLNTRRQRRMKTSVTSRERRRPVQPCPVELTGRRGRRKIGLTAARWKLGLTSRRRILQVRDVGVVIFCNLNCSVFLYNMVMCFFII